MAGGGALTLFGAYDPRPVGVRGDSLVVLGWLGWLSVRVLVGLGGGGGCVPGGDAPSFLWVRGVMLGAWRFPLGGLGWLVLGFGLVVGVWVGSVGVWVGSVGVWVG